VIAAVDDADLPRGPGGDREAIAPVRAAYRKAQELAALIGDDAAEDAKGRQGDPLAVCRLQRAVDDRALSFLDDLIARARRAQPGGERVPGVGVRAHALIGERHADRRSGVALGV